MKPELNDIRLLKLAEMYEAAYERFVVDMAERFVHDEEVRALLSRLTGPEDDHASRISAALERLNEGVGPEDRADVTRAALLDVCDVERSARDFYLRHADEVHDPEVARLFRAIAREEERHLQIAKRALALSDRKSGRVLPGGPEAGTTRILGEGENMVLREGVSDFGTHRVHRPRG